MERAWRIAKEMSALIVYCRSVAFTQDRLECTSHFAEMSSFAESKADRLICQNSEAFIQYHKRHISRVYPKGKKKKKKKWKK